MPVIINPDMIRAGFDFPGLQQGLGGGVGFLLLGVIIFIITSVFRKGIIKQNKNELTV